MSPRREFLTACGALAVPPVTATNAATDDPHLEWKRQLPGLRAAMQAEWDAEGPTYDALWERWIGLQDQICLTPARTPAGIAAQIEVALSSNEDGSTLSDNEVEGLRNAVRSLQQLAGRA